MLETLKLASWWRTAVYTHLAAGSSVTDSIGHVSAGRLAFGRREVGKGLVGTRHGLAPEDHGERGGWVSGGWGGQWEGGQVARRRSLKLP